MAHLVKLRHLMELPVLVRRRSLKMPHCSHLELIQQRKIFSLRESIYYEKQNVNYLFAQKNALTD